MNRNILTVIIIILCIPLLSAQQKDLRNIRPSDLQGIEVKGNSFFIKLNERNYKYFDKQKGKFTIRDYNELPILPKLANINFRAELFLLLSHRVQSRKLLLLNLKRNY